MSSSTTSMLELEQDTRPIHTTDKTKKRVTFAAENKNLTSIHEIPHLLDYSEEHIDELFYTEHELSYFRRDAQRAAATKQVFAACTIREATSKEEDESRCSSCVMYSHRHHVFHRRIVIQAHC
jgi:hypothetical protein